MVNLKKKVGYNTIMCNDPPKQHIITERVYFFKKEKEFSNNYFVNNELNGPDGTHMVTWLHGCVKLVVRK